MGVTSAPGNGFLLTSPTSSAYSIVDVSRSTSSSHRCAVGIWGNHPLQPYPVNPRRQSPHRPPPSSRLKEKNTFVRTSASAASPCTADKPSLCRQPLFLLARRPCPEYGPNAEDHVLLNLSFTTVNMSYGNARVWLSARPHRLVTPYTETGWIDGCFAAASVKAGRSAS